MGFTKSLETGAFQKFVGEQIKELIPPELKARTAARRVRERERQNRGRRQSVFAGFNAQTGPLGKTAIGGGSVFENAGLLG